MQQFLHYFQSRDTTIQSIMCKLDTLLGILEKKMRIEIFGENSIDAATIS